MRSRTFCTRRFALLPNRPKILAQPDKEKGLESIRAFGLFGLPF